MNLKTLRTLLEYALVICVIVEFNTVYTADILIRRTIQILPVPILLSLIFITPQHLSKSQAFLIFIYFVGSVFPLFNLESDAYISYIKSYEVILPLFFIYLSKRKQAGENSYLTVFFRYSNIMTILAGISIVMWLLCSVFQVIPMTKLAPYSWVESISFVPSYYNIYFETQRMNLFGELIYRNSSIFNEGPMCNMPLCVALAIEYFMRPTMSRKKITILVIAIISTLTTTGQLFLLALLAWHIFQKSTSQYRQLIIVLAPIFLILVYAGTTMLMNLKNDVGGEDSVVDRSRDIQYCIEAGMENPLFGVGIVQKEDMVLWRGYMLGSSNSLFAIFARGGIYMLVLYIGSLLVIPLIYYRKYKYKNWLLTMVCFFGLFCITVSFLKYLTLLFMAWGLSNIDLKRWNHRIPQ